MNKAVYFTDIEPEVVTLKGVKKYYVAGMVSTTDPDLVNDVLTKEAQTQIYDSIQDRITKGGFITGDTEHLVFYDENGKQLPTPKVRDEKGNLIIPELKFVEAKLLDNGVWAKAEVNSHHERFNTIWKSIQDGFLNAFSVAVIPIRKVSRLVKGVMTDFISDIKLINITLTGSPCNPNATMTPVLKSFLKDMDYSNSKKLQIGDKMDKKLKSIYDELSDEDKAKYDALESEEEKAEFLKGFEPEDKTEDEVQEPEVKDREFLMS